MEVLKSKAVFKKNLKKIQSYNTAFYIKTLHYANPPKTSNVPSLNLEEGFDLHIVEHVHHIQNQGNKEVWIFEDNFESLFSFLHADVACHFLKTGKCFFVHKNPQLLKKVTWYLATKKYKIYGSETFCQQLEQSIGELLSNLMDFQDFGEFIYSRLLKNVTSWDALIPFSKLKMLGGNKPCIIVGAGPSLEKNIHVIKAYQKKAFILAGGSSIKPLLEHDIVPDFLIALDPHDAQLKRAEHFEHLNIPTFFNNRVHPEVLKKIKGEKIYLGSVFGFPICHHFEKAFDLDSDNDFGWNILCALTKIAHKMDFSLICFVGMDFSYNTHPYAFEAFSDSRKQFLEKEHVTSDIFGKDTTTQIKWLQERRWIESYIEQEKVNALNCTE
ncbi:MAG: hypothetical protein K940chlam8_01259 [Chlamydiae bacterium]|nr:hypothetical protein [Chlamydiota bacterium]